MPSGACPTVLLTNCPDPSQVCSALTCTTPCPAPGRAARLLSRKQADCPCTCAPYLFLQPGTRSGEPRCCSSPPTVPTWAVKTRSSLRTQTTPASSCTTARRQRWQRLLCDKPCMQGCPCGHLECPLPTVRDSAHSVEGLVTQGGLPTLVGARCAAPGVNTHLHTTPPACLLAVACGCPAQLHSCTASHNRPLLPLITTSSSAAVEAALCSLFQSRLL